MTIPISKIKEAREILGLKYLVVYGLDEKGHEHVLTHGDEWDDAKRAAEHGNNLKRDWLDWPEELCNDRPLNRVCGNCRFFEEFNSETGSGLCGQFDNCMNNGSLSRYSNDTCEHFEAG
jgi:hypothetical protein